MQGQLLKEYEVKLKSVQYELRKSTEIQHKMLAEYDLKLKSIENNLLAVYVVKLKSVGRKQSVEYDLNLKSVKSDIRTIIDNQNMEIDQLKLKVKSHCGKDLENLSSNSLGSKNSSHEMEKKLPGKSLVQYQNKTAAPKLQQAKLR